MPGHALLLVPIGITGLVPRPSEDRLPMPDRCLDPGRRGVWFLRRSRPRRRSGWCRWASRWPRSVTSPPRVSSTPVATITTSRAAAAPQITQGRPVATVSSSAGRAGGDGASGRRVVCSAPAAPIATVRGRCVVGCATAEAGAESGTVGPATSGATTMGRREVACAACPPGGSGAAGAVMGRCWVFPAGCAGAPRGVLGALAVLGSGLGCVLKDHDIGSREPQLLFDSLQVTRELQSTLGSMGGVLRQCPLE